MRIIEQMTPCRCKDCNGKEQLTRMELIADSPEDVRQLNELAAQLRSEARAAGRPVIEHHIRVDMGEPDAEKAAKANAARNN